MTTEEEDNVDINLENGTKTCEQDFQMIVIVVGNIGRAVCIFNIYR